VSEIQKNVFRASLTTKGTARKFSIRGIMGAAPPACLMLKSGGVRPSAPVAPPEG